MKKRSMSMILLVVLVTLLAVVPVFAGSGKAAPERGSKATIRLNKSRVTLVEGKSVKLTAKVVGKSKKVVWYPDNKSVAIVKNGKVTGVKAGKAVVMAKANGRTAKCVVIVKKAPTPDTDIFEYSDSSGKTTTFAELRKKMPGLKFSAVDKSIDDEGVYATAYKLTDGYVEFLSETYIDQEEEYTENDLDKIRCVTACLLKYKKGYSLKGLYPGMSLVEAAKVMAKEGYFYLTTYKTTCEIFYGDKAEKTSNIICTYDPSRSVLKTVRIS